MEYEVKVYKEYYTPVEERRIKSLYIPKHINDIKVGDIIDNRYVVQMIHNECIIFGWVDVWDLKYCDTIEIVDIRGEIIEAKYLKRFEFEHFYGDKVASKYKVNHELLIRAQQGDINMEHKIIELNECLDEIIDMVNEVEDLNTEEVRKLMLGLALHAKSNVKYIIDGIEEIKGEVW